MLSTCVPHRGDPIAGCFVRDLALALSSRGHELCVVAAARRTPRGWDEALATQGVLTHTVRAPGASLLYDGGAPERLGGAWAASRALGVTAGLAAAAARHLRGCDALVSHFLAPSALVAGALRGGRPHLAVCHGSDARVFAALPSPVRSRVLREATSRWYVHPGLRDLVDPDDGDAVVCPMGAPRVPRVRVDEGAPLRVAVVGRLVAVKDVARALAAVAIARQRGADVRVEVVGDGPLGGALRARARAMGDAVTFHGALSPAARDAVLARCHALLHCARTLPDGRTEGAPLAVLESMAAGRCVVATSSGGVAWLLGDGGVLLPEDASPAHLADALLGLTDETRNSLGEKAMRRAEGWSWEAVAARVEAALR